jgi:hypothetical protein
MEEKCGQTSFCLHVPSAAAALANISFSTFQVRQFFKSDCT